MRISSFIRSAAVAWLGLASAPAWAQHGNAAGAAGVAAGNAAGAAGIAAGNAAGAVSGSLHGPPAWAGSGAGRNGVDGPDSGQPPGLARAAEVRRSHAADLMRLHPDLLDRDPVGNLVVRNELLGFGVTSLARASLQGAGFVVEREEPVGRGDAVIVVLGAPRGYSASRALRLLRQIDPDAAYDFNHIYFESGPAGAVDARNDGTAQKQPQRHLTAHGPGSLRRVGLIDGGVASDHVALQSARIVAHGCGGTAMPSGHGTAAASRLLDGAHADDAEVAIDLYAADVYCGAPVGGSAAAIADAIGWLIDAAVPVINVSLAGPPNLVLQRSLELAASRGHLVVAAVGNDGPAAPPLYPAAYPSVVAVTAVDGNDKVLPEAGRGGFVAFAAPGADVEAAHLPEGRAKVRGTSFAAPIVAGRLAVLLDRPDKTAAQQAIRDLAASAVDLGAPGRDPVYGNGCIGCGPIQISSRTPGEP